MKLILDKTELKEYAEKYKVEIGLENVWNKFLVSPMGMRDFIDKVDSKYVGSYFDVGNVLFNGYPEHWISCLGNRALDKDTRQENQKGTLQGLQKSGRRPLRLC